MKKKKSQKLDHTTQAFKALVSNALDFIVKSKGQIESSPKYAVINFCSGLELFLKARLVKEHWALIFANTSTANIDSFEKGDFESVSPSETVNRLEKILGHGIQQSAKDTFSELKEHRNRLIHFHHSSLDKTKIGIEICKGWIALEKLLSNQWSETFSVCMKEIISLNTKMGKLKKYYTAQYSIIEPSLEKERKKGVKFVRCTECKQPAAREIIEFNELFLRSCLVCKAKIPFLRLNCIDCGGNNELGEGQSLLRSCRCKYDYDYLTNSISDHRKRPKDELISPSTGSCSDCFSLESVILYKDKYLCLSCLTLHTELVQCEYCGENVTEESSYAFGCMYCDGAHGNDKS